MADQTINLETIGHLCQTFQRPYATIKRALVEVRATPAMTINGIEHYDESAVAAVAERLNPIETRSKRPTK